MATTIELTSKKLKAHGCLASVLTVVGIGLTIYGGATLDKGNGTLITGIVAILAGIAWNIITRIRIWWNHA